MEKGLKNVIVSEILRRIPGGVSSVNYLMNLLDLSRESVYRRIRGDIMFTFDEIVKLSLDLGLSVDELIGRDKTDRVFFDMVNDMSVGQGESLSLLLNNMQNYAVKVNKADHTEAVVAMNQLFAFMAIDLELLFRFFSYKWAHQVREVPLNFYFSEYGLPAEFVSLQNKIKYHNRFSGDITVILDQDIFLNTMKSIAYYYKRELITKNELTALKSELHEVIDRMARIIYKGVDESGNKYFFYLSFLSIDSNSIFTRYGNNMVSHFWVYSVSPISVSNVDVCIMHKEWLGSLKKYSALISHSNEIMQVEFFNKQYEYLEKIEDVLDI